VSDATCSENAGFIDASVVARRHVEHGSCKLREIVGVAVDVVDLRTSVSWMRPSRVTRRR